MFGSAEIPNSVRDVLVKVTREWLSVETSHRSNEDLSYSVRSPAQREFSVPATGALAKAVIAATSSTPRLSGETAVSMLDPIGCQGAKQDGRVEHLHRASSRSLSPSTCIDLTF